MEYSKQPKKEIISSCCPLCDPETFEPLMASHMINGTLPTTEDFLVRCEVCGEVLVEIDKSELN